jgi:hypothetical protein
MPEILHWLFHIGTPCRSHAVPLSPRYAVGRAHLRCSDGRSQRGVQFFGLASPAAGLVVGEELHVQCRQIVALAECGNFGLLNLADELSVAAHDCADGGV